MEKWEDLLKMFDISNYQDSEYRLNDLTANDIMANMIDTNTHDDRIYLYEYNYEELWETLEVKTSAVIREFENNIIGISDSKHRNTFINRRLKDLNEFINESLASKYRDEILKEINEDDSCILSKSNLHTYRELVVTLHEFYTDVFHTKINSLRNDYDLDAFNNKKTKDTHGRPKTETTFKNIFVSEDAYKKAMLALEVKGFALNGKLTLPDKVTLVRLICALFLQGYTNRSKIFTGNEIVNIAQGVGINMDVSTANKNKEIKKGHTIQQFGLDDLS